MTTESRRASLVRWAIAPKSAMAMESGLTGREARRLARHARVRMRGWLAVVIPLQLGAMFGWIVLVDLAVGIYEREMQFAADGSVLSDTAMGPFGITVAPLFFGVLLGPVMALVLGASVGFAAHFLLIDRETRRCVRTPACFGCGYDLASVVGEVCPECGLERPRVARVVRTPAAAIVSDD